MAEERCGRCHRKLKTPEAIAVGFGSSCYKMLFGKTLYQPKGKYYYNKAAKIEENEEVEGQISIFDEESEV